MKWITNYFINRALKKASDKKAAPITGPIRSIAVIAPSLVELHETIDIIKKEMGQDIKLSGLFYGEGTDANESFSYKDFSLSGRPNHKISGFLGNKVDVVIASSEKLNNFSLYLLYLNPRSYAVGYYQESHTPYLDLMLTKEEDSTKNMEHLLKYLKQVILI